MLMKKALGSGQISRNGIILFGAKMSQAILVQGNIVLLLVVI